ncbi:hypothetical protein D3C73_1454700 [compost metagenome]
MYAQARRQLRQRSILALHAYRALLHCNTGGARVQPHIEAGTGDGHTALCGIDHERPVAVVGDNEHRFAGIKPNLPPLRAVVDLQLRSAVEFQL